MHRGSLVAVESHGVGGDASPRGRRTAKKQHQQHKMGKVNTDYAMEFEDKHIPLERERQGSISGGKWEAEQIDQLDQPGQMHTLEVFDALGNAHPPSGSCSARGLISAGGVITDSVISSTRTLSSNVGSIGKENVCRWDRLHYGLTEGEARELGVLAGQPSSRELALQRVHTAVHPEELFSAQPPVAITACTFPPITERNAEKALPGSHYEYFAKRCPLQNPSHRAVMERRATSGRRLMHLARRTEDMGAGKDSCSTRGGLFLT